MLPLIFIIIRSGKKTYPYHPFLTAVLLSQGLVDFEQVFGLNSIVTSQIRSEDATLEAECEQ